MTGHYVDFVVIGVVALAFRDFADERINYRPDFAACRRAERSLVVSPLREKILTNVQYVIIEPAVINRSALPRM